MHFIYAAALALHAFGLPSTSNPRPSRVELSCHRTANEDVPENTLESIEQAALLGCDVVEVDIRRALDGTLVLNHDGDLERLTDGIGQVEKTYYDDLRMRDAGSWMGDRFQGLRIPTFDEALRLARDQKIRLYLDFKDKGMGADVLRLLQLEGMQDQVKCGGECEDMLRPSTARTGRETVGVSPGVSAEEVQRMHEAGKFVSANFSANGHGMDLAGMKAAVAAGVDAINVDYPRLGADAVGRPVEARLAELTRQAESGESLDRAHAILSLGHYCGFALEDRFAHWLLDAEDQVSRAAAVVLVRARPKTKQAIFIHAMKSPHADVRANAAWALGALGADASLVVPLLHDHDQHVRHETLNALAHMPGDVPLEPLVSLLHSPVAALRGAAAIALATHHPTAARKAVAVQLQIETHHALALFAAWMQRGRPPLTSQEIDTIVGFYLCQVQEVKAVSLLHGVEPTRDLERYAFRAGKDFAEMNGILSAFRLWDRIGSDPQPAVQALAATDAAVADRAEWMLVHGGPAALPAVRKALASSNAPIRMRAIRIVAWQGDVPALSALHTLEARDAGDRELAHWAIEKILTLHPEAITAGER